MTELNAGQKDSKRVAGAPFPPATKHDDTQERPRRVVPSSTPRPPVETEPVSEPTRAEPEEDRDATT